jgi:hypothetical protein
MHKRYGCIIAVITSGSVIGRAPIVSMPHWGGIIADQQLRALVADIKRRKTGQRSVLVVGLADDVIEWKAGRIAGARHIPLAHVPVSKVRASP